MKCLFNFIKVFFVCIKNLDGGVVVERDDLLLEFEILKKFEFYFYVIKLLGCVIVLGK